jgi:hypothetical protein
VIKDKKIHKSFHGAIRSILVDESKMIAKEGAILQVCCQLIFRIVDLLCNMLILFNILVLATTVNIMRDTIAVLQEFTLQAIDAEEVRVEMQLSSVSSSFFKNQEMLRTPSVLV